MARVGTLIGVIVAGIAISALMTGCAGDWFSRNSQPREEASQRSAPATSSAATPAASGGPQVTVLDTGNTLGIRPGGSAPSFTLSKPAKLSIFTTYHYVDGGGPAPGTLALTGADGKKYGPWQTKGLDGQGGVANAFWEARPDVLVPAGTYKVVDSDPSTWSTNDKAKGLGFTTVVVVYLR
jgi:hypothetical protein